MNECYTHATTWVNLKMITLSLKKKKARKKWVQTLWSSLHKTPGKCRLIYSNRKQISDCPEGSRVGQERWITKRHEETFGMMEMFTILSVVMVSHIKTCQTAHFKYVQCTVYQLFLNKNKYGSLPTGTSLLCLPSPAFNGISLSFFY